MSVITQNIASGNIASGLELIGAQSVPEVLNNGTPSIDKCLRATAQDHRLQANLSSFTVPSGQVIDDILIHIYGQQLAYEENFMSLYITVNGTQYLLPVIMSEYQANWSTINWKNTLGGNLPNLSNAHVEIVGHTSDSVSDTFIAGMTIENIFIPAPPAPAIEESIAATPHLKYPIKKIDHISKRKNLITTNNKITRLSCIQPKQK